jgi:PucR family transcriptional regulator, purine catabolism regulatory protein
MATVGEVGRAVVPSATFHRPPGGEPPSPDVQVGWVRTVRSRVPAFEALERGDLAIVPGASLVSLGAAGVDPSAVAEALRRADACGALVIGDALEPAAEAFSDRATALGLPVLRVLGADVAGLERSVIGYLVNARAELERQAAALEAELRQLALDGRGPDAFAADIAGFLGRAVAIEDAAGRPVALHAPADRPEAAAAATAYLRSPRRVALRSPLPGSQSGGRSRRAGALVLLGETAATELERIATERVAALIAIELSRDPASAGRERRAREALPADGPPWVAIVARQVRADEPVTHEERERRRQRLRRSVPARRLSLRGDAASLELRVTAAADADDPQGLAVADRISRLLGRPVALSRPFDRPDDRAVAEAEARATLEATEQVGGPDGRATVGVVRVDRLPAYRLLAGLEQLPDGHRQALALLAPLMAGRDALVEERLDTLRAVLARPGLAEAAAALGIHRNTLAYRLRRIEERTGWRLDDPDLRLALSLALRLVRNDQSRGS